MSGAASGGAAGRVAKPGAGASRVILASAGSGKTWQLSHAYLGLLADGEAPSSLLATTFTRKAAGEILTRVLEHLLDAAVKPGALAELTAAWRARGGPAATLDAAGVRALLGRFARDLSHGRVQTLDAFFVRLAGRFAQELGLPPGFRLGSETELAALRAQAVSRALAGAPPRELAQVLRSMQGDGAGRRVHEMLLDLVKEGHELLLDSAPEAWAPFTAPPRLAESVLDASMEALEVAELPLTGKGRPHATWQKARTTTLDAARDGDWERVLGGGLGKPFVAGALYCKLDFTSSVREALAPLVAHAKAVLLAELLAAGLAVRDLLQRYDAALADCQRRSGVYGFSDVTRLLRDGLMLDGAATALRDEGRLAHLLLDEFQDTSVAQWRVLRPLVEACLAARDGSRSLFCVGDVKQSIYGWRNGEPELLVDLAQRPGIRREELDVSRRSSQVVLDAVNAVFTGLARRAVLAVDDDLDRVALQDAATNWTALFREHRAHDEALPGCVSLREVAAPPDGAGDADARRRAVLDAASAHVAELARRAPDARIGILVRGRAAIAPLILGLRARGVHACGEGGNQLTDSAAVLLALSLLTLCDHPDDTAAAFHVATSPLAPVLGITPEQACERSLRGTDGDAHHAAADPRLAAAGALRTRLQRDGFGTLLAEWSARVQSEPTFSAWDRARFTQLVDLGFAHDSRTSLRVDDFVRLVREQRVEDPGGAPVRVLTVHGAKGLEYDAVVLPDLDGALPNSAGQGSTFLSSRRGPDGADVAAGPVTAVLRRVRSELRGLHPLIEELDQRAHRRAMEEQLSVLYVALTRARVRLDLFIEAPRSGGRQPTCRFGELLREVFVAPAAAPTDAPTAAPTAAPNAATNAAPEPVTLLHVAGDEAAAWPPRRRDEGGMSPAVESAAVVDAGPVAAAVPIAASSSPPLTTAFAAAAGRLPRTRSPSSGAHAVQHTAREILAGSPGAALDRGLLLHRFCQDIAWLEGDGAPTPGDASGLPDEEHLLAGARQLVAQRGLLLDDTALRRGLANVVRLLSTPAARGVFRRPERAPQDSPGDATPELWRERRFAVALADGELLRGAFDRVVVWRSGGRAVAAEVIDFKTDAPESGVPLSDWLAARTARYAPQMRDYRSALAALTGLPPARIACRLLFLQADAVRDVPT